MQIHREVGIIHGIDTAIGDAEFEMQESYHILEMPAGVIAGSQLGQIFIYGVMQLHEIPSEHLFVFNCGISAGVGYYIIYILDEHYRRFHIIEVLYERTVTSRTEQQVAILHKRGIVGIGGYCIGRRFLLGK